MYASIEPRAAIRLVICTGWGHDFIQLNELNHMIALGVARLGGAALLVHPPGLGDSTGSLRTLTVQGHAAAARDAAAEAARRTGLDGWGFVGVKLGAAAAALASADAGADLLAMVDPVIDLPSHFEELRRRARRLALGRPGELTLFGHPLPEGAEADLPSTSPAEALGRFAGRAGIIRWSQPAAKGLPEDIETVVVPGSFSTPPGPKEQTTLSAAAVTWIGAPVTAGVGR
ncbi:MAG TPA: hypothetical protein VKA30_11650 [Actinomycetota bacterium]|nr:hypothetical protein [Actinomycetota bacterium]